jgi:hypothetical protein
MSGPMTTSTVAKTTAKRKPVAKVAPTPPVATAPQSPAAPTPKRGYRSKRVPLYHPYQNITVPVGRGVPLIKDSWVEVQLAAKVIEEVDI